MLKNKIFLKKEALRISSSLKLHMNPAKEAADIPLHTYGWDSALGSRSARLT